MATRLFWRSTTAATSPTAGEKSTTLPVGTNGASTPSESLSLSTTKGSSTALFLDASEASTAQHSTYCLRFSSAKLAAQTISAQTWTVGFDVQEANAAANAFLRISLYVWRPSNNSVVGFIYDGSADLGTEFPTTAAMQSATFSGSSVTAQAQDILVCEVWVVATQSMGTSYNRTIYYNGTTETNGNTTDGASYIETPQNLTWFDPNGTATPGVTLLSPTARTVTTSGGALKVLDAALLASPVVKTATGGVWVTVPVNPVLQQPLSLSPTSVLGDGVAALASALLANPIALAPSGAGDALVVLGALLQSPLALDAQAFVVVNGTAVVGVLLQQPSAVSPSGSGGAVVTPSVLLQAPFTNSPVATGAALVLLSTLLSQSAALGPVAQGYANVVLSALVQSPNVLAVIASGGGGGQDGTAIVGVVSLSPAAMTPQVTADAVIALSVLLASPVIRDTTLSASAVIPIATLVASPTAKDPVGRVDVTATVDTILLQAIAKDIVGIGNAVCEILTIHSSPTLNQFLTSGDAIALVNAILRNPTVKQAVAWEMIPAKYASLLPLINAMARTILVDGVREVMLDARPRVIIVNSEDR